MFTFTRENFEEQEKIQRVNPCKIFEEHEEKGTNFEDFLTGDWHDSQSDRTTLNAADHTTLNAGCTVCTTQISR